jgi:hypothetical protein
MANVPAEILAELHAVAPAAFTRQRNARAAALAEAGQADAARAVRQLRRPTAALWAVNQLARAEPQRLAALLDAVQGARTSQLRDPQAATAALRRQRAELEGLVERAGRLLDDQGIRLTVATTRRISDTLLGAAANRSLADELLHGRLIAEVPVPGFEVLTDLPAAPPAAQRRPVHEADEDERQRAERARAEEGRRAARRQQAEVLEHEAGARAAAVRQAQRAVDEASVALAAARARLAEAQRTAREAAAAARRARQAAR